MSKFKVGDTVICINDLHGRTVCNGSQYTVCAVDNYTNGGCYIQVDPIGPFLSGDRFVAAGRPEAPKPAPVAVPVSDPVFRPSHYARFTIEPMTFAMANNLNGLELNVVKYSLRAPYKGKTQEDYDKAIRCLQMLKEKALREERIAAGEDAKEVWKVTL